MPNFLCVRTAVIRSGFLVMSPLTGLVFALPVVRRPIEPRSKRL
jgi:hypothetical protein